VSASQHPAPTIAPPSLHDALPIFPEGGTNDLAVKGCEEILTEQDDFFDYICCVVGTGGTISGIINSSKPHQKVLGFPALKGDFRSEEHTSELQSRENLVCRLLLEK